MEKSSGYEAGGARPLRQGIGALSATGLFGLLACCVAARLGHVDWRFDLLAHFHVQYAGLAVLLTLAALACGWRRSALIGLAVSGYAAVQVAPLVTSPPGPDAADSPPVRIAALNVRTSNRAFERAAAWLLDAAPDVAVVQETDRGWTEALTRSLGGYRLLPTGTARDDNFGMAVFVRDGLEVRDTTVHEADVGIPWIETVLELQEGPLRLFGVHTLPPMGAGPSESRGLQLREAAARASASEEPALIAGDLNATIWSMAMTDALEGSSLRPASLGRGLRGTWHARLWFTGGILIDHVLVDERLAVLRHVVGPSVGSDHLGVVVDVAR